MSDKDQFQSSEAPASRIEVYQLTGYSYQKWRLMARDALVKSIKWISRQGDAKLPDSGETIKDNVKNAPSLAVDYVKGAARKASIENQLKQSLAETEFQKQESEKLRRRQMMQEIRESRARMRGIELENTEKELRIREICNRVQEITAGKPGLTVIRVDNDDVAAFVPRSLLDMKSSSALPSMQDIGLPERIISLLGRHFIYSTDELIGYSKEQLLAFDGIGSKTIAIIEDTLKKVPLNLAT
jgi:hypothetical protein